MADIMMKYLLILLSLFLFLIISCSNKPKPESGFLADDYKVVILDDCEYIMIKRAYGYGGYGYMAHKGNCKNCK